MPVTHPALRVVLRCSNAKEHVTHASTSASLTSSSASIGRTTKGFSGLRSPDLPPAPKEPTAFATFGSTAIGGAKPGLSIQWQWSAVGPTAGTSRSIHRASCPTAGCACPRMPRRSRMRRRCLRCRTERSLEWSGGQTSRTQTASPRAGRARSGGTSGVGADGWVWQARRIWGNACPRHSGSHFMSTPRRGSSIRQAVISAVARRSWRFSPSWAVSAGCGCGSFVPGISWGSWAGPSGSM